VDAEAKARAIVDAAKRARNRPSRGLWIASLVLSAICVGALVIGYLTRDPVSVSTPTPSAQSHSGFGTGLLLGVAAGIAIGVVIALRKRDS
jgi:Na+/proline symporter